MDEGALLRGAGELELRLTPQQVEAFARFEEDLYEQNILMNLTRVPREECVTRHFLDSLLLAPHLSPGARVLDIGTGPGFPSWPLAIARPDLIITALDSSGKMLRFLARHPVPNLRIVEGRAESFVEREAFDFVTGRALAPLPIQLEVSAPLAAVGGNVAPMRTVRELDEFKSMPADMLGLRLDKVITVPVPGTNVERAIPIFLKVRPTPARFPRTWAEIRRTPLAPRPLGRRSTTATRKE